MPPGAEADEVQLTVHRFAHCYAPDQGATEAQGIRIDAVSAQARAAWDNR